MARPRRLQRDMRFLGNDRGQSMIELALTLPMLVFSVLGGADLARAFALQIAVENGSRAGAEAYAINSVPTNALAQAAAVAEINRTPTAAATASDVTVAKAQADGISACAAPPTIATPCFISVRVRYPWSTIVAWPLMPNGGMLDRTTTIRTFY